MTGRTARGNGGICLTHGGGETVEQYTSWVEDQSRGQKSSWRGHKMKLGAKRAAKNICKGVAILDGAGGDHILSK